MHETRRILIIYPVDFSKGQNRGIHDKMLDQGDAFQELNYEVHYAYLDGNLSVWNKYERQQITSRSWTPLIAKYFSFFRSLRSICAKGKFDVIYIRHLLHTFSLLSFLKSTAVLSAKIYYEYPTFPYEKEWKSTLHRVLLIEDSIVKRKVEKYLDKVVHYGGYEGKSSSVQITNGYSPKSNLNIKRHSIGPLKIIAVGRWEYWHGLDRLIRGMATAESEVSLEVVGTGPALNDYKALSRKLNISKGINFHGPKYGKKLEELLSHCHIGVGTLGIHRKGVELDSSLKHRMYCSYGLPFLFSGRDPDFGDDLDFVFKCSVGDDAVDIDDLIDQYAKREFDFKDIQSFAKENLSWMQRIRKIIEEN